MFVCVFVCVHTAHFGNALLMMLCGFICLFIVVVVFVVVLAITPILDKHVQ